jgi:hypothetical protein
MKKLLLLPVLLLMVAACSGKAGFVEDNSPEATVTKFFDALIAGNYEEAAKYSINSFHSAQLKEASRADKGSVLYDAYFPTMSYVKLQLADTEGQLLALIEVTAKDMELVQKSVIMATLLNYSRLEDASEEEIATFVTKQLIGGIQAAPATSTVLVVRLMLDNSSWTIINIDELFDALALSPLLEMFEESYL